MAYVNFGKRNTLQEALTSSNVNKIFFPTDSTSIVLGGKEYGVGVAVIERTSGNGAAGTTDTYTMYSDTAKTTAIGTFNVYNGSNGTNGSNATTTSIFSSSAKGLAPSTASSNTTTAETSSTVKYLCSDGKWRPLPSGAWATGTSTLALGTTSSTAYRGDYGNSAYKEAVSFGRGVGTYTSVAHLGVSNKNIIVTIADGQTSQTFSLTTTNLTVAGREIHIIVDNTGNSSNLSIGIPHGTINSVTYVNTNDCEAGSMTVSAGKIGEINVIYASSKIWIKYIGG